MKSFTENKVVTNASWIIFARIVKAALSFFVGILTTRFLGPDNYGLINYGVAYTAFFLNLSTLGINSIIIKELISKKHTEGTVLGTAITLQTIASVASTMIIAGIVSFLDADDPLVICVVLLCCIEMLFYPLELFGYWFQSRLQSKVSSIAALIAYLISSGYKLILLILKKNVIWFAFAFSVDVVCVGVIYVICYKKYGGGRLNYSIACAKDLLKGGHHFILPAVMVAVYQYADKFMLKHMMGSAENGYYSVAISISTMWCFVLSAIIQSLVPVIIEAHKSDYQVYEKKNRQLYAIVFWLSMLASVSIALLSKYIILIIYGESYAPTINVLRVVTWYVAFSYLGTARDTWIVCENKQKYLKYIYIISAFANVALNYIFIPIFGASGAAIATLVTQILTIISPVFIKPLRPNVKLMLDAVLLKDVFSEKEKSK